MYDFIIQISLFTGLAVMVYLLARAVPRLAESQPRQTNAFDRFLAKLPLDKVDTGINSFFERLLRKSKVLISKADNFVNGSLRRLKEHSQHKEEQTTALKEKMEKMASVDGVQRPPSEEKK